MSKSLFQRRRERRGRGVEGEREGGTERLTKCVTCMGQFWKNTYNTIIVTSKNEIWEPEELVLKFIPL